MTLRTYPRNPSLFVKNAFFAAILCLFAGIFAPVFGQEIHEVDTTKTPIEHGGKINISEVIIEHVMDHHTWHFFDGHYGTLYLPVIVYSEERGFEIFSSKHFFNEHHEAVEYDGYKLENGKVSRRQAGAGFLDHQKCDDAVHQCSASNHYSHGNGKSV